MERGARVRCSPELLDAYVDGELDVKAQRRLQGHLAHCARCSVAVEELWALKSMLRRAADATLDAAEMSRRVGDIVGHVRFREAQRQRQKPRIRFWQGALAGGLAGAVAAAVVAGAVWLGDGLPTGRRESFSATVEAVVSEHSRRAVWMETGIDDWADWQVTWERMP